MMTLQITEEETQTLLQILESDVRELRSEIAHTDNMDYREDLKRREQNLKQIIGKLRQEEQYTQ